MPGQDKTLDLFLHHRSALVRYAAHLMGDRGEAEDLVQEAWLRFSTIAGQRPLSEPAGYLHRIVRNLVLDGRRRKGLEQKLFESDTEADTQHLPSDQPCALTTMAAREELAVVQEAIAAMPERMRTAFEMHRFQGIKLVEIASRLAISKSLAQELVAEGVQRCRRALARRG